MRVNFQTAEQVASSREDTDEKWKTCRQCHCYSFRHNLKTQPLTGIVGDVRLRGFMDCKACGRRCQEVKQSLVKPPEQLNEGSRLRQFRQMVKRGY